MRKVFSLLNGTLFLLTEAAAVCLVWNILPAFQINAALTRNLGLILLLTALPIALLHLSFCPKPRVVSLIVLAAWLVGIGVLFAAFYTYIARRISSGQFEAHALFYILLPVVAALCYAASRFRVGLFFLLVGGVLLPAWFTLLKYKTSWVALVAFLICTLLLFAVQFYDRTVEYAHIKKARPFRLALTALIFCLICLGVSGGAYAAIDTQNLPVQRLGLLSNKGFQDLGKQWGFATIIGVPLQPRQRPQTAKQQTPNSQAQQKQSPTKDTNSAAFQSSPNQLQKLGGQKKPQKVKAITYFRHWPVLLMIIGGVVVALLCIYLGKILWRRRWYKKLEQSSREERIAALYRYILRILAVYGWKRAPGQTLQEYIGVLANGRDFIPFNDIRQFSETTAVYSRVRYGRKVVDESEYLSVLTFSQGLLCECRRKINVFKFGWKYLFV
ncbi:MAG: DUF4129 domain-containing protein [Ethanoligenens sp.]